MIHNHKSVIGEPKLTTKYPKEYLSVEREGCMCSVPETFHSRPDDTFEMQGYSLQYLGLHCLQCQKGVIYMEWCSQLFNLLFLCWCWYYLFHSGVVVIYYSLLLSVKKALEDPTQSWTYSSKLQESTWTAHEFLWKLQEGIWTVNEYL